MRPDYPSALCYPSPTSNLCLMCYVKQIDTCTQLCFIRENLDKIETVSGNKKVKSLLEVSQAKFQDVPYRKYWVYANETCSLRRREKRYWGVDMPLPSHHLHLLTDRWHAWHFCEWGGVDEDHWPCSPSIYLPPLTPRPRVLGLLWK